MDVESIIVLDGSRLTDRAHQHTALFLAIENAAISGAATGLSTRAFVVLTGKVRTTRIVAIEAVQAAADLTATPVVDFTAIFTQACFQFGQWFAYTNVVLIALISIYAIGAITKFSATVRDCSAPFIACALGNFVAQASAVDARLVGFATATLVAACIATIAYGSAFARAGHLF